MVALAEASGVDAGSATPMSGLAAQLMRAHANRGHAKHDPATLVTAYRDPKTHPPPRR